VIVRDGAQWPMSVQKFCRDLQEAVRIDRVRTDEMPKNKVMHVAGEKYTKAMEEFRKAIDKKIRNNSDKEAKSEILLKEAKARWGFFVSRIQRLSEQDSYGLELRSYENEDELPYTLDPALANTVLAAQIGQDGSRRWIVRVYDHNGMCIKQKSVKEHHKKTLDWLRKLNKDTNAIRALTEKELDDAISEISKSAGYRVHHRPVTAWQDSEVERLCENKIKKIRDDLGNGMFRFESHRLGYTRLSQSVDALNELAASKTMYAPYARYMETTVRLSKELNSTGSRDSRQNAQTQLRELAHVIRGLITESDKELMRLQSKAQAQDGTYVAPATGKNESPINVTAQYASRGKLLDAYLAHVESLSGADITDSDLLSIEGVNPSIVEELQKQALISRVVVNAGVSIEGNQIKLSNKPFTSTAWEELPDLQKTELVNLIKDRQRTKSVIRTEDIQEALRGANTNAKEWARLAQGKRIEYTVAADRLMDIAIDPSAYPRIDQYKKEVFAALNALASFPFNREHLAWKLGVKLDVDEVIQCAVEKGAIRRGFSKGPGTGELVYEDDLPRGGYREGSSEELWQDLADFGVVNRRRVQKKINKSLGQLGLPKEAIDSLSPSAQTRLEDLLRDKQGSMLELAGEAWDMPKTSLFSKLEHAKISIDDPELVALIDAGLDALWEIEEKPLTIFEQLLKITLEIAVAIAIGAALAPIPGASLVAQPISELIVGSIFRSVRSGQMPSASDIMDRINAKLAEYDPTKMSALDLVLLFAPAAGKAKKLHGAAKTMQSAARKGLMKQVVAGGKQQARQAVKGQAHKLKNKCLTEVKKGVLESEVVKKFDELKKEAVSRGKAKAREALEASVNTLLPIKETEGVTAGLRLAPLCPKEIQDSAIKALRGMYRVGEERKKVQHMLEGIWHKLKEDFSNEPPLSTLLELRNKGKAIEDAVQTLVRAKNQRDVQVLLDPRKYIDVYEKVETFADSMRIRTEDIEAFPSLAIKKLQDAVSEVVYALGNINIDKKDNESEKEDEFVREKLQWLEKKIFEEVKHVAIEKVLKPVIEAAISAGKRKLTEAKVAATRKVKASIQLSADERASEQMRRLENGDRFFGPKEMEVVGRNLGQLQLPAFALLSRNDDKEIVVDDMTRKVAGLKRDATFGVLVSEAHALPAEKVNGKWATCDLEESRDPRLINSCYVQSLSYLAKRKAGGDDNAGIESAQNVAYVLDLKSRILETLRGDKNYQDLIGSNRAKKWLTSRYRFGLWVAAFKAGGKKKEDSPQEPSTFNKNNVLNKDNSLGELIDNEWRKYGRTNKYSIDVRTYYGAIINLFRSHYQNNRQKTLSDNTYFDVKIPIPYRIGEHPKFDKSVIKDYRFRASDLYIMGYRSIDNDKDKFVLFDNYKTSFNDCDFIGVDDDYSKLGIDEKTIFSVSDLTKLGKQLKDLELEQQKKSVAASTFILSEAIRNEEIKEKISEAMVDKSGKILLSTQTKVLDENNGHRTIINLAKNWSKLSKKPSFDTKHGVRVRHIKGNSHSEREIPDTKQRKHGGRKR
jgi:hypothetical protein